MLNQFPPTFVIPVGDTDHFTLTSRESGATTLIYLQSSTAAIEAWIKDNMADLLAEFASDGCTRPEIRVIPFHDENWRRQHSSQNAAGVLTRVI